MYIMKICFSTISKESAMKIKHRYNIISIEICIFAIQLILNSPKICDHIRILNPKNMCQHVAILTTNNYIMFSVNNLFPLQLVFIFNLEL